MPPIPKQSNTRQSVETTTAPEPVVEVSSTLVPEKPEAVIMNEAVTIPIEVAKALAAYNSRYQHLKHMIAGCSDGQVIAIARELGIIIDNVMLVVNNISQRV